MDSVKPYFTKPQLYIFIVIVGIALKFYGIDKTYFWYDEIATIEQTAGYLPVNDFQKLFPANEVANIKEYTDVLHLKNHKLKLSEQYKGMVKSINLNPLHYAVLAIWYRVVGDDDIHYRYFNIFMLLLTLPILFKLCKTLFKSELSGWLAISIYSVMPFVQYYTHEARYNILCLFLLVLSQYLFLNAIKNNKSTWWMAYAITGILALYSSLLLGLIFLANAIYMFVFERKKLLKYAMASAIILLVYMPWLIEIIKLRHVMVEVFAWHGWWGEGQNAVSLLLGQLFFMSYAFATMNNDILSQMDMFMTRNLTGNYIQVIIGLFIIALIVYAIYDAIIRKKKRLWIYIALFLLPQMLLFLISDLARGTASSFIHRYNILIILGALLFITYILTEKILQSRLVFSVMFIGLIAIGIVSNIKKVKDAQSSFLKEYANAAKFISEKEKPLVITDFTVMWGTLGGVAILNECNSTMVDVLRITDYNFAFNEIDFKDYSGVYLMYCSENITEGLSDTFGDNIVTNKIDGYPSLAQIHIKN